VFDSTSGAHPLFAPAFPAIPQFRQPCRGLPDMAPGL